MEKLFLNCLGLDDPDSETREIVLCNWNWLCNQILFTNNLEIVHDANSKYAFSFLWYIQKHFVNNKLEKLLVKVKPSQTLIISDILNYDDFYNALYVDLINAIKDIPIILLTNNHSLPNVVTHQNIIVYDFLFNRTKLYYFGQDQLEKNRQLSFWYYGGAAAYQLNDLKLKNISKFYVAAFRRMIEQRDKLFNFLLNKKEQGYIGCIDRGIRFPGEETLPRSEIFYYPIPENLYQTSLVSIYIESTHSASNLFHPTEKTFDPLIKGSFILPFSNTEFINNLSKYYNFKFPAELDYSYDCLDKKSSEERLDHYLLLLSTFLNLTIDDLIDIYNKNIDIPEHNRQIFYDKEYDNSIMQLL